VTTGRFQTLEGIMQNTTDGSVTITRPGPAQEKRTVRYRYGGRALLAILLTIGFIVLAVMQLWTYAAFTGLGLGLVEAGTVVRLQTDLRWVLGIEDKS
jgi:hypothetical protein